MTDLKILYQDEALVAVQKPEGVLSHPNPGAVRNRSAFKGEYDFDDRRFDHEGRSLWLLHRLDQDTSGVLLAAFSKEAAAALRASFERQEVRKTYLALVFGVPGRSSGTWRDAIATERSETGARSRILRSGQPNAELRYQTLERFVKPGMALLEIDLITGRTHQIRVQLAARHRPVAGDRVYGNFAANRAARRDVGLNRLFLHAAKVELRHPADGRRLVIESSLPDDLEAVLERLSRYGRTSKINPRC